MATTDPFVARSRAKLQSLVSRDERLTGQMRDLEKRRAELAKEIANIRDHLAYYMAEMKIDQASPRLTVERYGDLKRKTISDGCEAILRIEGGRSTVNYVRQVLEGVGKLQRGNPHNYSTVKREMQRKPDTFQRVDLRGGWELVEAASRRQQSPPVRPYRGEVVVPFVTTTTGGDRSVVVPYDLPLAVTTDLNAMVKGAADWVPSVLLAESP